MGAGSVLLELPAVASASARSWQSYSDVDMLLAVEPVPLLVAPVPAVPAPALPVLVESVTFLHAFSTAVIAALEPARVSPGRPLKLRVADCSPTVSSSWRQHRGRV